MLRAKLMIEELGETLVAMTQKDLVAIADGLADLLVVTFGTALAYGIDIGPVWQAVHKSNMAKLGPDGQPIRREDGKVLKPADWQPPNIKEALIPSGFYDPRYHEPGA
jgi:predicted HAD superfamily Cof-like phosphohydrolase